MSDIASRLAGLSPEKRALLAQKLREQGSAAAGGAEPVAIVGLGCRFPGGVESPESFWRLISEGGDAVAEVPAERWSADAYYDPDSSRPGRMNTRWGSWLTRLDEFDTAFFGLAPRETARMDPQQRVVLEVCAEALEDAGQTLEQLAGSRTGVYVGTHVNDYAWMAFAGGSSIDAYDSTGTAHSIVANRVSYLFDLRGPSLAVDTACSSSLVAAHLAVQALRQRECDLALACGVNLMLSPLWGLALSKLGMLSPDGRCRTFDARANGIVRGEGCGAVVLKRLSDALADGDAIWALVRGSATNQDGRTNGLTAPNGLAQQAVVRAALANAGVEPQAVGAIEAHGTGTALGDPIEVEALGEVLGAGDPTENPCVLGSVKTNLGHLEGAAGIAGLIKLVLCLHHESLPRLVHFESPNPLLALSGTRFVLPRETRSWKRGGRRRLGGVSAFGFGGMNAHVILEEAPAIAAPRDADAHDAGPHALVVSARTPAALRQRAERLAGWLRGDGRGEPLADVCATAWSRRSRFEHGFAVVGSSREELATRLVTAAQGGSPLGVIRVARPGGSRPGLAFVFTGQGTQWPGVTRRLRESDAVVREALERCEAALRPHAAWSLLEELDRPAESSRLAHTEIAQPAVFAIQVALAAWWRSRGVVPEAVVGHSMGEVAAAHVAGVLSLEEAARIIVERARLMERTRGAGRMLAVELPQDRAEALARERGLSVATINSPSSCVLSGEPLAIQEAAAALERSGIAQRLLPVEYAFHSGQMADVAAELGERLGRVERLPAQIRMASTVSGTLAREGDFDAAYWARNVREPVRFASAVDALGQVGIRTFVELGPHPALVRPVQQCAALWEDGAAVNALASLHRDLDEPMALACARGALHLLGHRVDAGLAGPLSSRHVVRLPTYPWQRERFPFARAQGSVSVIRADPEANPLLGSRLPTAIPTFERELTPDSPPWLGDHRLFGKVLFPAAAFVSAAWAAGREAFGTDDLVVEDLAIRGPLVVPEDSSRRLQVTSTPEGDARRIRVWSASVEEIAKGRWEEHASARVRRRSGTLPEVTAPDPRGNEVALDADAFYARLATLGAGFGPRFRGILSVRGGRGRAVAEVLLPQERREGEKPFASPPLLDACLQVAAAALLDQQAEAGVLLLPVALERAWCAEARGRRLNVVALARSLDRVAQEGVVFDVRATDELGSCVMALDGFHLRPSREAQIAHDQDLLCVPEWVEAPLTRDGRTPTESASGFLLIADGGRLGDELAAGLAAQGERAQVLHLDRAKPAPELRPWLEGHLRTGGPWRGVVSLLPVVTSSSAGADLPAASVDVLVRGLDVIRAVSSLGAATPPRVLLVTRGARAVARGDESAALASAGLSGLVKVAALEHPELRVKVADLDPVAHANHVASLVAEIVSEQDDLEVAYRHAARFVLRIRRPQETGSTTERNERLERSPARVLEELRWTEAPRRAPGAGEVEIRVRAAGLNFRDVLNALGLYPGPEIPLGNECVGEISALGAGVSGLAVGERVLAVAFASIADYVTTPASLVVRKPDALSVAAAATLPIAFLTAHYALHELGMMGRGETVLIHAGAGGVGLAAVQLALRARATVFATAGSDEKRTFLRNLGVAHVMDSRSLAFADEVMAVTQGRGVDLVLNSLAGDFIARSLAVSARNGRFLELGKRDVLSAADVARQRPDVGYHVVYLGEVCDSDPARVGRWLQAIADDVAQGALAPLPFRVFPRTSAVESFRFMAQGRHVGKVVLELSPPNETSRDLVRPETTHLVTGGLGAIGLDVAEWLAAKGVGALALLGRSGASPAAAERLARLRERGTRVLVFACDVSDRAALAAVLARIDGDLPPLAGVWHAAGVLDDATLGQLDEGRFTRVFAPKVAGAVHLHELTRARALDAFVLFSSVASLLGWPGQGNYAAANAFLDALAHHRRELGLPGLSVNWGAWSGAGMAATRERSDKDRFARRGLLLMDSERALAALIDAHRLGRAQVGILALDFGAFSTAGGAPGTRLMLSDLADTARANVEHARAAAPRDLGAEVAAAPASRRRAIVAARVREQALRTLGLASDFPLDSRQGLRDVGLDSLMAVELRNALQQLAGQPLPSTLLFDFPTVEALSAHLLQAVGGDRPQPRAEVEVPVAPESTLSDEEAEALLREELARSAPPRSGA